MTHLAKGSEELTRAKPQQGDIILGFMLKHLRRTNSFSIGVAERMGSKIWGYQDAFLKPPRERLPENEPNTQEGRARGGDCRTES